MKHRRRVLVVALSAASSVATFSAASQERDGSAYIGGAIGNVKVSSYDDSDTGFTYYGGYRFNRHLSVEASYSDLGEVDAHFDCPEICIPEFLGEYQMSADRFGISLHAGIPVSDFVEIYAKAGFARTSQEIVVSGTNSVATFNADDSGALYGIGANFTFGGPWALRLQWDRQETDFGDYEGLWIGGEFRFE